MKHIKLFENYFNKVSENLKEKEKLEKLILKYISWKHDYSPTGFYIKNIVMTDDDIIITTDSNNNQYRTFYITDKDEFDKFCKNPELFKETEKYNL